jgi:hypothetical protein
MKFRDLRIGQHFRFTGENRSWDRAAKKTSGRCYVWADKTTRSRACLLKGQVGTVNVEVVGGRVRRPGMRKGRKRGWNPRSRSYYGV